MAEKKPKTAAAKKAVAAQAEKDAVERTVKWQGLAFTLPAEFPEAILLDLALINGSEDPGASFEMLVTLIGENQFRQVRNRLKADDDVTMENVAELIRLVFEEYGTSEGESEASQDS